MEILFIGIISCIQISIAKCTIDVNAQEFSYIANHLTPQECRRLFAALHFTSYKLPSTLSLAEESVPQDVSCIKLLLKWNSGEKKWEGKDKTHIDIAHRLQQLGRSDLANWLGRKVFHELAKDALDTLDNSFKDAHDQVSAKKLYVDKCNPASDEWTDIDYVLWFTLIGLILTSMYTFGNIIVLTYKKGETGKKIHEEDIELISRFSMDSDEDTIFNYQCTTAREVHVKCSKDRID